MIERWHGRHRGRGADVRESIQSWHAPMRGWITARQDERLPHRAMETRCERALFRAECHGCERERPIRTLGKEGQASSVAAPVFGGPAETKKARSVVALSRVPRAGRGPPVSPLTVSPRVREADASRGGSPASCPDAHRPTCGHRHVRVWARLQISSRVSRFKRFVKRSRRAALKPRGGRARAHVDVTQKRNTATATTQVQRPDGSPSAAAAIEVLSIIRLLCS